MMFAIYRTDRTDRAGGRVEYREAHLAYLEPFACAILCAGAVWSAPDEKGQRAEIGSLYLVDFDDEDAARAFAFNDPFHLADLFETVDVRLFQPRMGTRKDALTAAPG